MIKIISFFFLMLILSVDIYASPSKLNDYNSVKQELIEGKTVKTVIDFSQCKITMGDTGKPLRHVLGLVIENFMISDKTKGISVSHHFLNSLDKRTPYGAFGYRLGDVTIMPNNEVIVDTAVLRLPENTLVAPLRLLCKMNEGANFYTRNTQE